jgi:hypothetical protein
MATSVGAEAGFDSGRARRLRYVAWGERLYRIANLWLGQLRFVDQGMEGCVVEERLFGQQFAGWVDSVNRGLISGCSAQAGRGTAF